MRRPPAQPSLARCGMRRYASGIRSGKSIGALWQMMRRAETLQRPARVLGKQRIVAYGKVFEQRHNAGVGFRTSCYARISQCDAGVANHTAPLRAFHRAAAKNPAEFFLR